MVTENGNEVWATDCPEGHEAFKPLSREITRTGNLADGRNVGNKVQTP